MAKRKKAESLPQEPSITPQERKYQEYEANARVTSKWKQVIGLIQMELFNGQVMLQIINGEPTDVLDARRTIKVGKDIPPYYSDLLKPA